MFIRPSLPRSRFVRFCVAVAFCAGCHEIYHPSGIMPADGEELPILNQISGVHSHETRALSVVVRDSATLSRIPLVDVPVDFSREMLLIVTLGRVTSDRYRVSIDRVWREGGVLRAATTIHAPGPGAPVTMASPFCIAVVPRCDLNVAGFLPEPPARTRSWEVSSPPEGF